MNREKILKIYRESIYDNNSVRDGFALAEAIPDGTIKIFIPQATDGTMVRILREYGIDQDLYVSETRKDYRAMLHRMPGVRVVDNRSVADIDSIRTCGKYKKFPECRGCKNEPAKCRDFLGLPDQQFDVVISLEKNLDRNILQRFSGNVILNNTDRKAEEQ